MSFSASFIVTLALVLPAVAARAQNDWIDLFPSPTTVAHAAFEELKVTAQRGNSSLTTDDDSIAINLAGSFVVMRQLLFLKYNAEKGMAPQRQDKLRRLAAAYAQAELAIGQGAAGRRGYISRAAPSGTGCGSDQRCYRRWFELHLNASTSRAEYRQRLLQRLFPCSELATELYELRQRHATTIPFFASPSVTLQIEPELVGHAPAGCATMGGDRDGNGLCDDWERVAGSAGQPPPIAGVASACSPKVELGSIRHRDSTTIEVSFKRLAPTETGVPVIHLFRGNRTAPQDEPIAVSRVAIAKNPAATGAPEVAMITTKADLKPIPAVPWLSAVSVGRDNYVSNAVACKQAVPVPILALARADPVGYFGPYPDADSAACAGAALARAMTDRRALIFRREIGVVVLTARAKDDYYLSSFVEGNRFSVEDAQFKQARNQAEHFSCRSPWSAPDVHYAGTIHTHIHWLIDGNDFSRSDIEDTLRSKKNWSDYERNYLVGTDGRVYSFDGSPQRLVPCPPTRSGP
jgi:hypothetical protein